MHTPRSQPQPPPPPPRDTAPLTIIAQEAKNVAASFGLACAGNMAQALVQRLLSRFGGQKIYIPSETAQSAKRRGTEIREQFTGNNLSELASNHRLSKRQVRNILTQADKAKADRPKQKTRP